MPIKTSDDIVDLGSAYSFPASDPPSYMASLAVPGVPAGSPRESETKENNLPPAESLQTEFYAALKERMITKAE